METGVQQRWILFYFLLFQAAKLESYCALTKTIIFYRLKTNSVRAAHVLTLSQPARVLRNTCVTRNQSFSFGQNKLESVGSKKTN